MHMPTPTIDSQLVDELVASTRAVFKTMVFHDLEAVAPIVGDALRPDASVVGSVAFAGKTSGMVVFYSTLDGANLITASMLGIEPDKVNGELPDAIGELTNLIAGSFRSRMVNLRGDSWAISVPTVTIGTGFSTKYASHVHRALCPFRMGACEIFVELIVTPGGGQ